MDAELLIACFAGAEKAEQTRASFLSLDPKNFADAIVLSRKPDGQLVWLNGHRPELSTVEDEQPVPEDVANFILSTPQESQSEVKSKKDIFDIDGMRDQLIDKVLTATGLTRQFLKDVGDKLQPDHSVLVLILEGSETYTSREQLREKCGDILQITVNPEFADMDSFMDDQNDEFIKKMISLEIAEQKHKLTNKLGEKIRGFKAWLAKLFHLRKR